MTTHYLYHYTYLITNLLPNSPKQYYIGVRSCNCLPEEDPYMSSSKYIKKDITKYGLQLFEKIIINSYPNRLEALLNEIQLHNEYNIAINELFYNRAKQTSIGFDTSGVPMPLNSIRRGSTVSKETREKISKANKGKPGRKLSIDEKNNLSMINKGKKLSKETKLKMSKTHTGMKHTKKSKQKMSENKKGKKLSKETKLKMSKTHTGKKLSKETKLKISENKKGKRWYYNGKNIKMFYPNTEPKDFKLGRK